MKKLLILLTSISCCVAFAASPTPVPTAVPKVQVTPLPRGLLTQSYQLKPTKDIKVWDFFMSLLPSTQIQNIFETPDKGIYMIGAGKNIFYGQVGSPFVLVGHMFNPYTQQDLSEMGQKVQDENYKIDITKIDVTKAIVSKAKNNPLGKKIFLFSDPDCPYCRNFEQSLKSSGLLDRVDVYRMLIPLPMHPNAKQHIQNIYCANDKTPLEVLDNYMINGNDDQKVTLKDGCSADTLISTTAQYMREYNINGTPTVILGNGKLIQGADTQSIDQYVSGKPDLPTVQ